MVLKGKKGTKEKKTEEKESEEKGVYVENAQNIKGEFKCPDKFI